MVIKDLMTNNTEYQEAIKYRFSMLQENFIDKLLEPYLRIKVRE
jgi:hypothetical protein